MFLVRDAASRCNAVVCAALVAAVTSGSAIRAQDRAAPQNLPPTRSLTLDSSVEFALENNPQLMALRQQHGIAAAGVVIAKTYPFNPIYQGSYQNAQGPRDARVLNSLLQQHQVTLEVQLLHQQRYRQQAAFAALSRTDWEIAAQELTFAINAVPKPD